MTLPFIEDDYPRALAEAKAKNKLLFVDVWATWCHACLSLKSYVFSAPEMRKVADQFVWLSVDNENEKNLAFVEKYKSDGLPALWVVDASGQVLWRLMGTLSAPELVAELQSVGNKTVPAAQASLESAYLEATRADARKDEAAAAKAYEKVLAMAPANWPKRPAAVVAYVNGLGMSKQNDRCTALALKELPSMPLAYRVTLAGTAAMCARGAAKGTAANAALGALIKELTDIAHTKASVLPDDRSDIFRLLISSLKATDQSAAAKQMANEWVTFLEDEARRASDPQARAVFDSHRTAAYTEVGDPGRAIPMLQESERDFPKDYNPSTRLSRVYLRLKRYDEALDAANRGLAKAYGPSKLSVYQLKADIAAAKSDRVLERKTLDDALLFASTLPPLSDWQIESRAELTERRRKLGPAAPP